MQSFTIVLSRNAVQWAEGALHCKNVKRFGANTVKSSAMGTVQWAGGALPAHELGRKWPLGGHTTQTAEAQAKI